MLFTKFSLLTVALSSLAAACTTSVTPGGHNPCSTFYNRPSSTSGLTKISLTTPTTTSTTTRRTKPTRRTKTPKTTIIPTTTTTTPTPVITTPPTRPTCPEPCVITHTLLPPCVPPTVTYSCGSTVTFTSTSACMWCPIPTCGAYRTTTVMGSVNCGGCPIWTTKWTTCGGYVAPTAW